MRIPIEVLIEAERKQRRDMGEERPFLRIPRPDFIYRRNPEPPEVSIDIYGEDEENESESDRGVVIISIVEG